MTTENPREGIIDIIDKRIQSAEVLVFCAPELGKLIVVDLRDSRESSHGLELKTFDELVSRLDRIKIRQRLSWSLNLDDDMKQKVLRGLANDLNRQRPEIAVDNLAPSTYFMQCSVGFFVESSLQAMVERRISQAVDVGQFRSFLFSLLDEKRASI